MFSVPERGLLGMVGVGRGGGVGVALSAGLGAESHPASATKKASEASPASKYRRLIATGWARFLVRWG